MRRDWGLHRLAPWCALGLSLGACGGNGESNDHGSGTGGAVGGGGTGSARGGSTSSGGSLATGDPVSLEDYPTALGAAVCPGLVACCGGLGIALTSDQCRTTFETLTRESFEGADPNKYTYDPVAAGVCLNAAAELFDASLCALPDTQEDPFCDRVFSGTLAAGDVCNAEVECARQPNDDVECSELETGGGNVCVIEREASDGDACYWTCTFDDVSGVQACSGSGNGRPAIQGQCFTNDELYCSSEGTCEQQGGIGDACAGADSCGQGFCSATTGECTSPAGENGSCTSDSGCEEGLYCDAQVCVPELEPGAPCEITDECRNGDCEDGVCVENPPNAPGDLGLALLCAILASSSP